MRKRGKHYRGKGRVDPVAGLHAIAMQHAMSDDQLRDLGLAVHSAIERMRIGEGIEADFHTLAAAVNVSLILCERSVGSEYEQVVKDAQDALLRILERGRATAKWGFDGAGYKALTQAAELHEQQIANVSRRACREAMVECRARMLRGQVLQVTA